MFRRTILALRSFAAATLFLALVPGVTGPSHAADPPNMDELLQAIVKVKTFVPADARSAQNLGTEREGTGILIDASGLIVTIGYVILEADRVELTARDGRKVPAEIVGYDYESGFGLIRALTKIAAKPMKMGESAEVKVKDRVLAINHAGNEGMRPAVVVSRREFAGYWEYMLPSAIFTAPPIMDWGGAALVAPDGRLVERLVTTAVTFKRLSDAERAGYVESQEWHGKAGGYAIQGQAALFVRSLAGSYSNVVGLPLFETAQMLRGTGYPIPLETGTAP